MDHKESWNKFLTPARDEDLQSLYEEVMGKASSPGAPTEEKPFYVRAARTMCMPLMFSAVIASMPFQSASKSG